MNANKNQLLRDPNIQLSDLVISNALGDAYQSYKTFISIIEEEKVTIEWRYYSDGKAWLGKGIYRWTGLRGAKKETTVFWLSVWEGFFKISVFIHEKYRDKLIELIDDDDVKKRIENINILGTTLKYLPVVFNVSTNDLFPAIITVFKFKKEHIK
jgi:hypothetical protein